LQRLFVGVHDCNGLQRGAEWSVQYGRDTPFGLTEAIIERSRCRVARARRWT
jgi:hypothetical protein